MDKKMEERIIPSPGKSECSLRTWKVKTRIKDKNSYVLTACTVSIEDFSVRKTQSVRFLTASKINFFLFLFSTTGWSKYHCTIINRVQWKLLRKYRTDISTTLEIYEKRYIWSKHRQKSRTARKHIKAGKSLVEDFNGRRPAEFKRDDEKNRL